jgi:quercetin dioxygenase-like cupin family protein
MDIRAADTITTTRASAEYFTGAVWQEALAEAPAPARLRAVRVSFEPGARTAWHTHPLGQTLYVTSGLGIVQVAGGLPQAIRPGDVVWIPPGEKHWHGAAAAHAMTHLALQEALNGSAADWLEYVSDTEYSAANATVL